MTRTKFEHLGDGRARVAFDAVDPWTGDTVRRVLEFVAPSGGGYLREAGTGRQLCDGFAERGPTLLWGGRGRLVDYLRAEYRRMRAAERRKDERRA